MTARLACTSLAAAELDGATLDDINPFRAAGPGDPADQAPEADHQ